MVKHMSACPLVIKEYIGADISKVLVYFTARWLTASIHVKMV